ncbi:hypothetical protein [Tabrizicola oligotrophica]|uniref:Uncharacterized protein n=1 Tax=Tabrizicola oligotrophica TaxID=2710650 RepID=A0A6M0QTR5_9RHOB|nr:hypothetical protein [Tabrizicola oligotrophica]NEY90860.1 hypothetical protein [Tabrizicola oligotrophica]
MFSWGKAASLAAAVLLPGVVLAETQSEILFQHKHWEVEIVGFDDGTFACLAEVDASSDSFTIWLYADNTVKLQFYSTSWEFGEGDTADLQVQIGNRAHWNLNAADLYKNSILFNLPDSDQSVNFLTEVAEGSRLYLRTAAGEPVMDYSLQGSSASMGALAECGDALQQNDGNPFD